MAVGAIIWLPQDKYATLYSIVSLIIITESAHCSHLNIFTHLHILYYVFTVLCLTFRQ